MSANSTILFVDQQSALTKAFLSMLKKQGFNVRLVEHIPALKRALSVDVVSTVIVSMDHSRLDGLEVIHWIAQENPALVILALTENPRASQIAQALEMGARDYFVRPIEDWTRFYHLLRQTQDLWSKQLELIRFQHQREQLQQFRNLASMDQIKGRSEAIHHLLLEIQNVAPLDVATLVIGESGVGKERVAMALHAESGREGTFVAVNCAAISADLFEAELFGYKKGAFTGANQTRDGLCKTAAKGTLFLDEVGELPLTLQAKLLRLLEQREYRPVGSDTTEPFTGRIVTATNVNLEEAIQKGKFRQDLFYRISVQELYVPPLRERIEDIQLLAYYFIEQFNKPCNRQVASISPSALTMLESYDWHHNNVRELQREVQRALVRVPVEETELDKEHLFWHRGRQQVPSTLGDVPKHETWLDLPYLQAKKIMQTQFLQQYLQYHVELAGGNKRKAAKRCGLQPSNFSRLWKELNDSSPD